MNPAHLHLMLNHVPLVGIGFTILLMVIALYRKNQELINISLVFIILVSLWAIPAYLTGEPAEELVENMPGISGTNLEEHEHFAENAFIVVEITGVIALLALIARKFYPGIGRVLTILSFIALVISGGMISWTANLGGRINHPEIRTYDTQTEIRTNNDHD